MVLLGAVYMKLIALLTDYGSSDHYVGVIKGVIKGISPESEIMDLTHEVRAYDIRDGAFLLLQASKYLPRGCTVMAVVDPGSIHVGGRSRWRQRRGFTWGPTTD